MLCPLETAKYFSRTGVKAACLRGKYCDARGIIVMPLKWQPTPVFLPGESHEGRSLVGYSPWGRKEWDTTELLHLAFDFFCAPAACSIIAPIALVAL